MFGGESIVIDGWNIHLDSVRAPGKGTLPVSGFPDLPSHFGAFCGGRSSG